MNREKQREIHSAEIVHPSRLQWKRKENEYEKEEEAAQTQCIQMYLDVGARNKGCVCVYVSLFMQCVLVTGLSR